MPKDKNEITLQDIKDCREMVLQHKMPYEYYQILQRGYEIQELEKQKRKEIYRQIKKKDI